MVDKARICTKPSILSRGIIHYFHHAVISFTIITSLSRLVCPALFPSVSWLGPILQMGLKKKWLLGNGSHVFTESKHASYEMKE
jgi:hypothetical protein